MQRFTHSVTNEALEGHTQDMGNDSRLAYMPH
jgi:hypothetical protein